MGSPRPPEPPRHPAPSEHPSCRDAPRLLVPRDPPVPPGRAPRAHQDPVRLLQGRHQSRQLPGEAPAGGPVGAGGRDRHRGRGRRQQQREAEAEKEAAERGHSRSVGRCRHRLRHRALMGRRQVGNPRGRWHPPPVTAKSPPPSKAEPIPGRGPRAAPRRARPRAAPGRDGTGRKTRGSSWRLRARGHRGGGGTGGTGTRRPPRDPSPGAPGPPRRAHRDPPHPDGVSPVSPKCPLGVSSVCSPVFPRCHPQCPPCPPPPPDRTGTSTWVAPARRLAAPRDRGVPVGLPGGPRRPRQRRSPPGRAARGAAIAAAPTGRLRRFPLPPGGAVPGLPRARGHAPAAPRAPARSGARVGPSPASLSARGVASPVGLGGGGRGRWGSARRSGRGALPWGPRGTWWDPVRYQWDTVGCQGTAWDIVGCLGTHWDPMGGGELRDTSGRGETPWGTLGPRGVP